MDRIRNVVSSTSNNIRSSFSNLSPQMRIGVVVALVLNFTLGITMMINYQKIIEYTVDASNQIREMGFKGVLIFVFLLSIVSFPPLIGFSSLCIIIGIVYGFNGFPLIAITSSIMSAVSLCCFKYFFREKSQQIIDSHENLQLFVSVIKDSDTTFIQEIVILTLMKLCPLPYSITNGGLGCVPHLSPLAFFLACIICSPKYLIQLFLGIQLRKIGDIDQDGGKKSIDFIILLITASSFGVLSMLLYRRLKYKIEQRSLGGNYLPMETV